MGFVLDGLDTESYDRQYKDTELVRRIMGYFSPFRKGMIIVALFLMLNSVFSSIGPILLSKAVDLISENPSFHLIIFFSLAVILVGGLSWLSNYIYQRLSARITGNVVLDIRSGVFRKTIEHDLSFYDEHPTGKIVSRVTSDTRDFTQIVHLVLDLLSQVLLVVILLIWLFTISVWLTLLLLAMAPAAFLIAISFRKIARKVTRHSKRIRAKINAQIQESISGIMVAKAFRQEKQLYDNFSENNDQSYRVNLKRGIIINLIFPIIAMASALGTAAILYAAGGAVKSGELTPGTWYLFMQTVGFFWWPILNIASFWSQFQDGLSAAERVFALIDRTPRVVQTGSQVISSIKGSIEFRDVWFSYSEKETVLCDFSLDVKPGETVAFVGHTGAGKSSIIRLISRFYEFQKGTIMIDGKDIRSLDLGYFRSQIGLVPQDPFLFTGTVSQNIKYACPGATDEDVLWAATHVGSGEWISDLPRGLDSDVGQRGSGLSMGQRQLVALARVLLKNPAIFILDEATASVDPFTEVQIKEGLHSVMEHRTALIIAHRLSTVKEADRIIVIQNGKIIEQGTHTSLLQQSGHYAMLYNTYFRHQSLDYIENQGTSSL